ncbi:MAG: hypothetical protein UZ15_CFX003002574 [Chloroflexi bacterium OLB15]|nr:MAG: hypothetical protein UZ15_CFX003002574 [Chloroflexi bacterium OLB15]
MSSIVQETPQPSSIYHVDREHGSLRLIILLLFIGLWVIIGGILGFIVSSDGLNLLAILIGFFASYGITALIERRLKTRWRSGRYIEVTADAVRVIKRGNTESELQAGQAVTPLLWRFQIRKRARIPKGWWMYALGLEGDAAVITAYAFFSPAQSEAYALTSEFKLLEGKKKQSGKQQHPIMETTTLRAAGEERRLRAAEEFRWISGAEMPYDDFIRYVEQIKAGFPEWAPLS